MGTDGAKSNLSSSIWKHTLGAASLKILTLPKMWDKREIEAKHRKDVWFIPEYTPKIDKRINYHNVEKKSSLKLRPFQIMIKGWLKTIKDINCNFSAISVSRERALAASYFQTLLFQVKTVCRLIQRNKGKKEREEKKERKHFSLWEATPTSNLGWVCRGCNCCSGINKARWTTRVQSMDLRKKKRS